MMYKALVEVYFIMKLLWSCGMQPELLADLEYRIPLGVSCSKSTLQKMLQIYAIQFP